MLPCSRKCQPMQLYMCILKRIHCLDNLSLFCYIWEGPRHTKERQMCMTHRQSGTTHLLHYETVAAFMYIIWHTVCLHPHTTPHKPMMWESPIIPHIIEPSNCWIRIVCVVLLIIKHIYAKVYLKMEITLIIVLQNTEMISSKSFLVDRSYVIHLALVSPSPPSLLSFFLSLCVCVTSWHLCVGVDQGTGAGAASQGLF